MPGSLVVNSSPLILLARVGRLDLLQLTGRAVLVPETVAAEVSAHSDQAAVALKETAWLQIVPDLPVPESVRSWDLGAGESSVLAVALAGDASIAILDDYAARKCAEVLNLPIKGTLGLVLLAKKEGAITFARPLVEELHRKGLYLSAGVIDAALRLVGE